MQRPAGHASGRERCLRGARSFVLGYLPRYTIGPLDKEWRDRRDEAGPRRTFIDGRLDQSGSNFAGVASTDPVVGWEKGIKTLSVAAFTGSLAMQFTARKDWMSRVGVSPKSTLADKLKAFRGARIGASTIGGGPAQYTRYLARTAGIDPEHDMKILAVGFGAARMAALRTNQVDVTVGDAPEADQVELEGFGELFLNCSHEVPIFKEFPLHRRPCHSRIRWRTARFGPSRCPDPGSGERFVRDELRPSRRCAQTAVCECPCEGYGTGLGARSG